MPSRILFDPAVSVKIPLDHFNLIMLVEEANFYRGHSGTGPSFSCAGEPPEPDELVPTVGKVQIEGEVPKDASAFTIDEKDYFSLLTNDNQQLFDRLSEDFPEVIEAILFERM